LTTGEQELVQRAIDGDKRAFEELVRMHQGRVVSLCTRMLGRRSTAEEVAQEAFVAAYRNLRKFRGDSRFGTWVYRIAINRCKNRIAHESRRHSERHDSMHATTRYGEDDYQRQYADDSVEAADDMIEKRDRRALVRRAIDQLPQDHRQILVLRDLEELSYDEISDMLNLSPGTVKSRLHRARHALKDLLAPMMRNLGGEEP